MQLYSDMMMARDLCRYGHVDDFCLHNIVKCRSGFRGVLSDDDIEIFNEYLEDNDLPTAFGIPILYESISGLLETCKSDTLKSWMEQKSCMGQ